MKKTIMFFLLTFLFSSFFVSTLNSQGFQCNVELDNETEYANYLNSISPNNPTPTSGIVQQIPIHIYHVLDNGAPFPVPYDFDAAIIAANEAYAPAMMSFYICDETYVNNTEHSYYSVAGDHPEIYDLMHDDNALNVYHVNIIDGASGWGFAPFSGNYVAIDAGDWDPFLLSHELGHYFGLLHTHEGGQAGQYVNYPIVDPLINNGIPSIEIAPNEYVACNAIGDRICDTPGDPGVGWCSTDCSLPANCSVFDPVGDTYNPNRNNIMSFYHDEVNCDDEHFSPDQINRIFNTLMNTPQRSYLLNLNPSCPTSVTLGGKIERYCETVGDPIPPNQKISIINVTENETCENLTNVNGNYFASYFCRLGGEIGTDIDFSVAPKLFDPDLSFHINHPGLTAFDLALIQQHILGINLLDTPYKLIAADANGEGNITVADIGQIQSVILGINLSFPFIGMEGASWRFVPDFHLNSDGVFNTQFFVDPFSAVWTSPSGETRPYYVPPLTPGKSYMDFFDGNLQNSLFGINENWSFKAIKIGDVNCNSNLSPYYSFGPNEIVIETRESGEKIKIVNDKEHKCLEKGNKGTIQFSISSKEEISSYQLGISFDAKKIKLKNAYQQTKNKLNYFNQEALKDGELKTVWWNEKGETTKFSKDKVIFILEVEALDDICDLNTLLKIDQKVLTSEFYDANGNTVDIELFIDMISGSYIPNMDDQKLKVNIYPNPSDNKFSFEVETNLEGEGILIIFDYFGNAIEKKISVQKGKQVIRIDDTSMLSNGLLYYQLKLNNTIVNGKLIKLQ